MTPFWTGFTVGFCGCCMLFGITAFFTIRYINKEEQKRKYREWK